MRTSWRALLLACLGLVGAGGSWDSAALAQCVIAPPAPASTQTRARVGAYYFDGWAGPLRGDAFQGLLNGTYQGRQPLSGWQDNSSCAIEQQLAWARNSGINFFVFDWYFQPTRFPMYAELNSALQITHSLPDRHGMEYAILYVNGVPWDVQPADWPIAVNEWVGYMADPSYLRINGIPAFFVANANQVRAIFGSAAAVNTALGQLRTAAQAQGLPGVYIVGGFGIPDGTMGQESLNGGFSIVQSDGYDAVAFYNYPFAPPPVSGMLPFSTLSAAGKWVWDEARLHSSLPFIPTAMSGWDPRPWNEVEPISHDLMWYSRTPQDVATFVSDAITWVQSNPTFRVEASPAEPMVLIEAWNELGEGSYIVPTVGDGTSYGDALAAMLTTSSNYAGLWWAAPAGSESGWGINFAHQADTIFASWFTYDLTGKGLWLVMTALQTAPNTYSGALLTTTGPAFNAMPFSSAQVVATQVGDGTLTFTDASNGTFSYTVNGISQMKAITREVFGTLPTCATATGSLAAATNYQDLWWAAPAGSESGWGINLTHQGDTIFATWFTYDVNGSPMWLVVTAPQTASGVYSGTLYRTTGPAFNAVPFNPANVVATAVGMATLTFNDGNNATFAYTVNGIAQNKAITREVFVNPGTMCQ